MDMKSSIVVLLVFMLEGCTAYRVAGEMEAGRQDLLIGKNESAIAYFQQAAKTDPRYARHIGYMQEGVWTYLGRANYNAGELPEARQSLQRALAQNDQDYLADLYLGLVLARSGDRKEGLKTLSSGLKGLDDWLVYTKRDTFYGAFWDPSSAIESEINGDLAMISTKEIDWPTLIASGEWIGKKTEEEIDLARRDERREYERDGDGERVKRH